MILNIGKHSLEEVVDYRLKNAMRASLAEYDLDEKSYMEWLSSATTDSREKFKQDLIENIARAFRKEKTAEEYEKIAEDIRKEISDT